MPKKQAEVHFFVGKYEGDEVILEPTVGQYYIINTLDENSILNCIGSCSVSKDDTPPDPKHTDIRPRGVTDIKIKTVKITLEY